MLFSMSAGITRRQIGLLIATATGAKAQAPAQATGPEQDLEAIRARRRNASAQLAKVKLPISTDPAFVFRA